jgi:catalase
MRPAQADPTATLAEDVLHAFDEVNGPHPGFRPAHAKGILLSGRFTPSPTAPGLSRAPHFRRGSTPVSVRFSDFGGIPSIPDNDPNASPRGFALRFHLAEHVHTDIIAHSADGFPVRTAEEFVEFLRAIAASGPGAPTPSPIESFLATHPAAARFIQMPKPIPASFATESYFGVSAYKFINEDGLENYGRYRIRPEGPPAYLEAASLAKQSPNFLFEEIEKRLSGGAVRMRIAVQLANGRDVVNDSTVHWPNDRPQVDIGTFELLAVQPDNQAEQRQIIFDPIPRVDGIEASDDPLLDVRANIYLMSGRRRRSEGAQK